MIVEHYEQNNAIEEGATCISGIKILNVDNENDTMGPTYYCNLSGLVVEIRPRKHASLPSGIYVFADGMMDSGKCGWAVNKPNCVRIDHNDAITHTNPNAPKLYHTADQARTLGDMKKKLEEDRDERKLNSEMKKYDHEMKKYARADTSEFFKWLPTIVGGIISIIGAFFL